jgi:hypothetical protein
MVMKQLQVLGPLGGGEKPMVFTQRFMGKSWKIMGNHGKSMKNMEIAGKIIELNGCFFPHLPGEGC